MLSDVQFQEKDNFLRGWVWKKKPTTDLIPGYEKVYAKLDLGTLELVTMRKEGAQPKDYEILTVVRNDTSTGFVFRTPNISDLNWKF